jgi:uncharacterized membrane protein YdjX (TVP38/TMEM64 family)
MRLFALSLVLAALVIVPFLIWGDISDAWFDLGWLKSWGHWAALAGFLVLVADLIIPAPGTVIISGLGYLYGVFLGGLIGAAGLAAAGTIGYLLCRRFGEPMALRLLGARDLARGRRLFSGSAGPWVVAISRWTPVLPEVVACMAGLLGMPGRRFFPSMILGSLPVGFTFAAIGTLGHQSPVAMIGIGALIPLVAWMLVRRHIAHDAHQPSPPQGSPADED